MAKPASAARACSRSDWAVSAHWACVDKLDTISQPSQAKLPKNATIEVVISDGRAGPRSAVAPGAGLASP